MSADGRDVTVVVPTRNRATHLALTVGSIVVQRDVDLRVVVVDEGSTDGTAALLARLAGEGLSSIRHDEPRGLAAARNAGIERATTTWVACCDDDDVWAPDKLSAQLDALARVPGAGWSCTGAVSIDVDRRVIGFQRPPPSGDVREALRVANVIPAGGSSLVTRTALVREVGGYDPWPTGCEDYDLHCRLAAASPVATVDRPLVGYRVWPGTMSTDVARMRIGHLRTLERHRGSLPEELARQGDRLAEQYWARFHLRNGDRRAALAAYTRVALRYRLPGQLAYAVWGAVDPRGAEGHQAARERGAVPADWAARARAWLDELQPA